jgi:DNA-binding transcriptional MerR regulator
MQRAGNRRYYRPADVELARRINRLLNQEGYTVRGVQKLLRDKAAEEMQHERTPAPNELAAESEAPPTSVDVFRLIELRNRLASAIDL